MERTQFNHSESIFDSQDYNSEPISNLQNSKAITSNSPIADKIAYAFGADIANKIVANRKETAEQDCDEVIRGFIDGMNFNSSLSEEEIDSVKTAYSFGARFGKFVADWKEIAERDCDEVYPTDIVIRGFIDGMNFNSSLSEEEIDSVFEYLEKKVKMKVAAKERGDKDNLSAGKAFLDSNAKKAGVVTTKSGLQYKVIYNGTGPTPIRGQDIRVSYKGTLIDGTVFDETTSAVELTLDIDNFVIGLIEGIQLMKVGSEFEFYIPAKLAYGDQAVGQYIQPNSVLIYNVTLHGINSKFLKF